MHETSRNRREFLGTSLAAGAGLLLSPKSHARVRGANERLRVGIIGCGGRGGYHLGQVHANATAHDAAVVAVCDVWRPARERMAANVEKRFGAAPRTFARHQDLLAEGEVDVVFITTPDHAHCPVLIDAARAGKHAFCEKPMSRTFAEAKAARAAVLESGIVMAAGTQRRSEADWVGAARTLRQGLLGKISEIDTCWHDSGPRWAREYSNVQRADVDWEQFLMGQSERPFDPCRFRRWHFYDDYTNGTVGLLGSHFIDAALMMVGEALPRSAVAHGGIYVWNDGREHEDTVECLWDYPAGFLMRWSCRLGNAFRMPEMRFYGTTGTFDTHSWKVTPEGASENRRLKSEMATPKVEVESHVSNFLRCVRAGGTPVASIEQGFNHAVAASMAHMALRSGRRMVYDAEAMDVHPG